MTYENAKHVGDLLEAHFAKHDIVDPEDRFLVAIAVIEQLVDGHSLLEEVTSVLETRDHYMEEDEEDDSPVTFVRYHGNVDGSHRQGEVTATLNELRGAFGHPSPSVDSKITFQWHLLFSTDKEHVIATLYDYRNTPPLDGTVTHTWSVGGYTTQALDLVRNALAEFRAI